MEFLSQIASPSDIVAGSGSGLITSANWAQARVKRGVALRRADNTWAEYHPTANSNAARGAALAAAAAAAVAGDTMIRMPGGGFNVADSLPVLGGLAYEGDGYSTQLIQTFANGGNMFAPNGVSGWAIRNLRITGNYAGGGSIGSQIVTSGACLNWRIDNVDVDESWARALRITSTQGSYNEAGLISNFRSHHNVYAVQIVAGSEYNQFSNCQFTRSGSDAVTVIGGNNHFSNCVLTKSLGIGLVLQVGSNDTHGSWTGGIISHSGGDNIYVNSAITGGWLFSGTHIYGNSNSVGMININVGCTGLVFNGCTLAARFRVNTASAQAGHHRIQNCTIVDESRTRLYDHSASLLSGNGTEYPKFICTGNYLLASAAAWADNH